MEHSDLVAQYLAGSGVEIGAFKTPIPGIKPIYVDRFANYAGEPTLADCYGDAYDLPFFDSSVDFVATSHVIEHTANPLSALAEWFRVVRHKGFIYMVIPDRRKTFDHPRPLTEPSHMLDDYRNQTTQVDGTHINDFVYGVDWIMFSPLTLPDQEKAARDDLATVYRRSVEAGNEINIHFHTFESSSAAALIRIGNREAIWNGRIQVIQVEESFPDSNPIGFLIVAQVHKNLWGRLWNSLFTKKGLRKDARQP
jgi:SAM-dependent methyltransferase